MQKSSPPPEVCRDIHPNDNMWKPDETWYFAVGRSGLRSVQLAIDLSWLTDARSFLDLPCGYGRVARYLRAAYPGARMYFCDIDNEAADFCASTFDGTAIYSKSELTDVALPKVDVIWVGSLFTHVDLNRTHRWLAYLSEHLNPDGVVVATFHGQWSQHMQKQAPMIDAESWEKIVAGCEETGFGYAPYPEGGLADYGISLTRPSTLCNLVDQIPGVRLAGYMERGWAENHDVVVVSRDARTRPWAPDFRSWK